MTKLNIILEEEFNKMFGDIINNPVIKEIESKNNNKNKND